MSTYDQTIANLKSNNWQTTNNIITYNNDIAKFETQKFAEQSKLWALAGKTGFELTKKIVEKRKTDQENEVWMQYVTGALGIDPWNQSEEAQTASESLTKIAKFQNNLNDNVTGKEINNGLPSNYKDEARFSTGKPNRMNETIRLTDLKERFSGWVENQKRTNGNEFYVDWDKDGTLDTIRINDPNLNFNQKVALQRHLTKEYFNLHNLQRYSKEFLLLPTDRGGSGFLQSMLETNQSYFKKIQTEHKIELSESSITLASKELGQVKSAQSFEDTLSELYAGYDAKGNNLGFTGAWKRMHDKIMPALIDSYKLSPDDIIRLGDTVKIQIPDPENPGAYKSVLLKDYRKEWGKGSKWHNEALKKWKDKGELVKHQNRYKVDKIIENTNQAMANGITYTEPQIAELKAGIDRKIAKHDLDIDVTDFYAMLDSNLTGPEAEIAERQVLTNYDNNSDPNRLLKDIKGLDSRITNGALFQKEMAKQAEVLKEIKPVIDQLKVKDKVYKKGWLNLKFEDYNDGKHREKWQQIEAYAVNYAIDNPDKSKGEIQDHVTDWITKQGNTYIDKNKDEMTIDLGVYNKKKQQFENYEKTWLKEPKKYAAELAVMNRKYAEDTKGYMPNFVFGSNTEKPIINDRDAEEMDIAYGDTLPYQNAEAELTDPNTKLPFEDKIFGVGNKPNYNNLLLNSKDTNLQSLGLVNDMYKEAKRRKITLGELLKYRHKANGLGEVDKDVLEYFSDNNLSKMNRRIRDIVLGYEPDEGHFTVEQMNHDVSINGNPGDSTLITYGGKGEEITYGIDNIAYKKLNKDGSTDDPDVKLGYAYFAGCVASINNTAINDTTDDGAEKITKSISEIPPEQLAGFCQADPKVGWYAYGAGAPIDVLKVVPELQETKGKENVNKIANALQRFLGTNVGEDTSLQSGTDEPEDMSQYYQIPEPQTQPQENIDPLGDSLNPTTK